MEEFIKPSASPKPTYQRNVAIAVGIAVGIVVLQAGAAWIDGKTESHLGQVTLGVIGVLAFLIYWESVQNRLDEIGHRLATESAAFAMRGMIAAGLAVVLLWPISEIRDVVSRYGFPIYFAWAGLLHAIGYFRAKRRLS